MDRHAAARPAMTTNAYVRFRPIPAIRAPSLSGSPLMCRKHVPRHACRSFWQESGRSSVEGLSPLQVIVVSHSSIERAGLCSLIDSHPGYRVAAEADSGREALRLLQTAEADVAIIDYFLPDMTALSLSHFVTRKHPGIQILLYTEQADLDWVIQALREGARAFVSKDKIGAHLLPALAALADHRPYWNEAVGDEVLTELLEVKPPATKVALSSRELQVLQLTAEGHTRKEMADALGISHKTVESFLTTLKRKLGLRNIADLVRYAAKRNIIRL